MDEAYTRTGGRMWYTECGRFALVSHRVGAEWRVRPRSSVFDGGAEEAVRRSGILDRALRWPSRAAAIASLVDVGAEIGVPISGRLRAGHVSWFTLDGTIEVTKGYRLWSAEVLATSASPPVYSSGHETRAAATAWAREQQAAIAADPASDVRERWPALEDLF